MVGVSLILCGSMRRDTLKFLQPVIMNIFARGPHQGANLKKKLPFTLVEILIVFFILALSIGIIGINIHKAIVQQRFETEVALVLEELRFAQDLMLILDGNFKVKFEKESNGE